MSRSPEFLSVAMKLQAILIAALLWLSGLVNANAVGAQSIASASIEQLKAAIIFNFGRYVEWPAKALPTPETPIRFCIGEASIIKSLSAQTGRKLQEHPIAVVPLEQQGDPALHCHVAYIPKGAHLNKTWLEKAVSSSTLLVTEDDVGVIRLVEDNARLAFEIDRYKAEQAQLVLSSHLLRLAKVVHEEGRL